jgi:hypothetical protein
MGRLDEKTSGELVGRTDSHPRPAIDPDNLLQFREKLNVVGEFLVNKAFTDPEARKAYATLLYVQSSLKLDAEEMRLAGKEISELAKLKAKIDLRLNNQLCEMKPNYDDSITGFNEAWDTVRKVFAEAEMS